MKNILLMTALALGATANAATLGFLGPKGTYSDQVATEYAKSNKLTLGNVYPSITATGAAVVAGQEDYGLVPDENSSGAFVAETSGILAKGDPGWRVINDVTLPINNTLLVKPGTKASDIKTIISHPQPFKQSAGYLTKNFPNVARQEVNSTAAAAEAVSKGDGTSAALSAPAAAAVYGLEVLASNTQDDKNNATNFWIVQKAGKAFPAKAVNRVIVMFDAPAGGNALGDMISNMRALSFQPLNIQSSPNGGKLYGYRYVVTFNSMYSASTDRVQTLVSGMGNNAILLGAYQK